MVDGGGPGGPVLGGPVVTGPVVEDKEHMLLHNAGYTHERTHLIYKSSVNDKNNLSVFKRYQENESNL